MKLLSLIAIGLVIALSGGAQTTTDEKQQPSPAQKETAKPEENVKANEGREVTRSVQPKESERARTSAPENATKQEGVSEKVGAKQREGTRVQEKSGNVSRSTTVFRKGRETKEQLSLHRSTRERTDVHFNIGIHDRTWWLASYTIVVMDSCPYYLADDGCWYPAYGFDPSCTFPEWVVYCE